MPKKGKDNVSDSEVIVSLKHNGERVLIPGGVVERTDGGSTTRFSSGGTRSLRINYRDRLVKYFYRSCYSIMFISILVIMFAGYTVK
jgi:hypothetical protein